MNAGDGGAGRLSTGPGCGSQKAPSCAAGSRWGRQTSQHLFCALRPGWGQLRPAEAEGEACTSFLPTDTRSGSHQAPHTAARGAWLLKSKSHPFSAQNPAATPSAQRQAQAQGAREATRMTCHPRPQRLPPSPTPSGHRSHFPFTSFLLCPLPPAPLLSHLLTSRSSFKRSLRGAFPMTPPKTPLAQHPQSPFLHYRRVRMLSVLHGDCR